MVGRPEIGAQPAGVGIEFDVSLWPLVLVTMPGQLQVEDIVYLQESYEAVFAAPTRHALVVDTTTLETIPDATLRRRMKEFEDGRRPIIRERNIGSAIVLSNRSRTCVMPLDGASRGSKRTGRKFPRALTSSPACLRLWAAEGRQFGVAVI
jgi:hypothetical protein